MSDTPRKTAARRATTSACPACAELQRIVDEQETMIANRRILAPERAFLIEVARDIYRTGRNLLLAYLFEDKHASTEAAQ